MCASKKKKTNWTIEDIFNDKLGYSTLVAGVSFHLRSSASWACSRCWSLLLPRLYWCSHNGINCDIPLVLLIMLIKSQGIEVKLVILARCSRFSSHHTIPVSRILHSFTASSGTLKFTNSAKLKQSWMCKVECALPKNVLVRLGWTPISEYRLTLFIQS